jgi:hypothetical protein
MTRYKTHPSKHAINQAQLLSRPVKPFAIDILSADECNLIAISLGTWGMCAIDKYAPRRVMLIFACIVLCECEAAGGLFVYTLGAF